MPVWVVGYPAELAVPPLRGTLAKPDRPVTRLVPAHVASPGPKRAKVTVPVGLSPPLTVAASLITTPTVPDVGEALVAIDGAPHPTMRISKPTTPFWDVSPCFATSTWSQPH